MAKQILLVLSLAAGSLGLSLWPSWGALCYNAPDGTACDDYDACNQDDQCYKGECKGGAPLACDDSNPCTDDSCHPKHGCIHENNAEPCDNHNACTLYDKCSEGFCGEGQLKKCEDNNLCTTDRCDPGSGCVFEKNQNPCDDGNSCTVNDQCKDGYCASGKPLVCSDDNVCTTDSCHEEYGCVFEFNSEPCNDYDACTVADRCAGGSCKGGRALACSDSNICTTDSCHREHGCIFEKNRLPCDDYQRCTIKDTCYNGTCKGTPMVCDDRNQCTDDSCHDDFGCVFEPNKNSCDDYDVCTKNDRCYDGSCRGQPVICDDGNPCTTDSCRAGVGCVFEFNSLPCEDGNVCTKTDQCVRGQCVGRDLLVCKDDNICTTDSCHPQRGCVYEHNRERCDDGNVCTLDDRCTQGKCRGGRGRLCADDKLCTTDSCHPQFGCMFDNNAVPCDDANRCTVRDVCGGGLCQPGAPLECKDKNKCTTDSCHPEHGCIFEPNADECDDYDACTLGDKCTGGKCVGGTPLMCDDYNFCTEDSCHREYGCVFVNNDKLCDDLDPCTITTSATTAAASGARPRSATITTTAPMTSVLRSLASASSRASRTSSAMPSRPGPGARPAAPRPATAPRPPRRLTTSLRPAAAPLATATHRPARMV